MLKRVLVAALLFILLVLIWHLPVLLRIFRSKGAIGIGFVRGSLIENVFRIFILLLIGMLSFWLSGKLVNR